MNFKHGMHKTATYRSWADMKQRCTNQKAQNFASYGGRGITVCDRWLDFSAFLEDMGEAPAGMTIERVSVNGNYEPGNCKWATVAEQMSNQRKTIAVEIDGERVSLREACRRRGLNYRTIQSRVNILGMTPEDALARGCRTRQ